LLYFGPEFAPFVRCPIYLFAAGALDAAKSWIATDGESLLS